MLFREKNSNSEKTFKFLLNTKVYFGHFCIKKNQHSDCDFFFSCCCNKTLHFIFCEKLYLMEVKESTVNMWNNNNSLDTRSCSDRQQTIWSVIDPLWDENIKTLSSLSSVFVSVHYSSHSSVLHHLYIKDNNTQNKNIFGPIVKNRGNQPTP